MTSLNEEVGEGVSRREARTAMAARLGVQGDFVRVPQLAKALGISSTSIHSQMRRGSFPIAHRRVGDVIVVKLDDYIEWFNAERPNPPVAQSPAIHAAPTSVAQTDAGANSSRRARSSGGATRAEFKAKLRRDVLESMRRDGFQV